MESFSFEPVASWWIIAVIMAVLAAALWVGPQFQSLTNAQKRRLFLIRLLLVGLVFLALLRPGIVSKIKQKQSAVLAVMLDLSRSMKLSHQATGPTRWKAMVNMIGENQDKLDELAEQNIDVRFYGFGNRLRVIESAEGVPVLPDAPTDGESDLGSALFNIVDSFRDQRLLGVFLVSDGVQNVADPPIELAQAGKLVQDSQTPLFAVPLGQSTQTDQFADIAVENMPDQFTVWVKNDLTVSATVTARGFANQVVPVQLIVVGEDGVGEVVDTVQQPFEQANESVAVELTYTPEKPGQYRLIVRAEPQAGEVSPRNNELPGFLTVNEGGLKVLYVYGSLNWETTFLIRSLGAYKDIQLDQLHIDRRQEAIWPLDKSAIFSDDSYDIFILHDVDSRALHSRDEPRNLNFLAKAVEDGKGLIMIGGYHSFGPGIYRVTPLAKVLPIRMDLTEQQEFDEKIREDLHIPGELKPVPAAGHFVTQLGDPIENRAIWEKLPAFVGANKFFEIKDTAFVILESDNQDPLLVSARYGGRVLAMAADTTYLWWTHGFADQHKRFWRQIVLWLAFKDGQSSGNVQIDLPQRRFQPNQPIQFTTRAANEAGQPITDAQFRGSLVNPEGVRTSITVINSGASEIDRKLLEKPGIYTIEVAASRNDEEFGRAAAEFVVFDNDKEQANPSADPALLNRLAERTSEYGGRLVEPDAVPALLDELVELAPQIQIDVPLKWQLGDTWYDALIFVLLFAGFLTYEWWLRKKWGLV